MLGPPGIEGMRLLNFIHIIMKLLNGVKNLHKSTIMWYTVCLLFRHSVGIWLQLDNYSIILN